MAFVLGFYALSQIVTGSDRPQDSGLASRGSSSSSTPSTPQQFDFWTILDWSSILLRRSEGSKGS
ncbi:hypothetical protein PGT21_003530 [Puccinia graminis f. sp. tritici]|uniref:Uncharacterized protein n=1 Tax=Puccinia graminis f. sp. tritici TaxID=56615 RepID=A0A5B0QZI7_PUCGR|nr:hypothetical protein PGT21_003530 [Puccinia graminis f. sp. tritici]